MVFDVVTHLQQFADAFIGVYILLILLLMLTTWFPRLPYSLNPVLRFLHDVCDPYLAVFRRFIPPFGAFDFSPMAALIVLIVFRQVLHGVLGRLH
jgi:YggT family protein